MSAAPDLLHRLRAETAPAHARLERGLALMAQPPRREVFVDALGRFYGFHAVWEPAIRARIPGLLDGRSRLPHLRSDLARLGEARPDGLARCSHAAGLTATAARAMGSFYVMEGSTLGGMVIAKALEGAAWLPPGGLTYFSPYGRRTAEQWRAACELLSQASHPSGDAEVLDGAVATFDLLAHWLTPSEAQAA